MLRNLLVAVAGVIALSGIWVAVQHLARKTLPGIPKGGDVLACKTCEPGTACRCGLRDEIQEPVPAKNTAGRTTGANE